MKEGGRRERGGRDGIKGQIKEGKSEGGQIYSVARRLTRSSKSGLMVASSGLQGHTCSSLFLFLNTTHIECLTHRPH